MHRRLDIQGLRALAVLAVIFYHFRIWPFTGGFVGVDIFFVISGYLITGMILEKKHFSIGEFYSKRVRRLVPALLVTIIATFVAGAVLLFPQDFRTLSQSALYALGGISNVCFWLQADYFDATAITKALLHTWSLSVELQFYLFWPVFLLALSRLRWPFAPLVGIIAAFSIGTVSSIIKAKTDPTGAFYLTPYRMHEFALGGVVWCLQSWRPASKASVGAAYIGAVGMLFATIFLYSDRTNFPGWTVLPVMGATAILIWLGPQSKFSSWIGTRPAVFIGEVSYSAYLVHWPVLVLAVYPYGDIPAGWRAIALLALTAALTLALYYLVEKPFRLPVFRATIFNSACAAITIIAAALTAQVWLGTGWAWRMKPELQSVNTLTLNDMVKYVWSHEVAFAGKADFTTQKTRVLFIGDSQMADALNVLVELGKADDVEIIARPINSQCGLPYIAQADRKRFLRAVNPMTMKEPQYQKICPNLIDATFSGPAWQHADIIVVGFLWRDFELSYIASSMAEMGTLTKAPIYLIGSKRMKISSTKIANLTGGLSGTTALAREYIDPVTPAANQILSHIPGMHFIDILSSYCSPDRCEMIADGKPVYMDAVHLTEWGARHAAREADPLFHFLPGPPSHALPPTAR